jgi:ketol-acid reductoisomerase
MKQVLKEIQDGTFAKAFLADQNSGRKKFLALREEATKSQIEEVGQKLRSQMAFIDPITVEESKRTV